MPSYVLNEELKRLVVQVVNQHMGSFQARPKRTRRVRRGGGGGSGGGLTYFVLTEAIGAATGDTSSITPDTALAQRYATDSGTKDRTPTAASPETIYNYDTCQGWADGTAVWCFTNDAGDWEIDSAACCTLSAP